MIYTNHKIRFDAEKCVGCKLCYKAGIVDVIRWDEEAKKPIFKYVEDCEHCFVCQSVCKKDAIEVCPDFSSEHFQQTFEQYR
jgi:MinD superfamily P-loop ATPase